jgi:septum formation protein
MHRLTLASASPRRSELLRQIGVAHTVTPSQVDEVRRPGEAPAGYVRRLACAKAEQVWAAGAGDPVLGADTAVVLEGEFFGKPLDRRDCVRILMRLSGHTHEVYTAVALRHAGGLECALSVSEVTIKSLAAEDCARYWDSGEPRDKAGAYAIQGLAGQFVSQLSGSYSGVMGLPLYETALLLAQIGAPPDLGPHP